MGIFDKIFNKKQDSNMLNNVSVVSERQTSDNTSLKVNLSKEESLKKVNLRKETISKICLEKQELTDLTSRVAVVMDYSGSMRSMFKDGTVQSVLERLLPLALKFDDNGELDVWLFESRFTRINSINIDNFHNYVENEDILRKYKMGGTKYAPVIEDVSKKYIKEEPSDLPTLVLFITDGDNTDKTDTTKLIKNISSKPIFWQFIGLGSKNNFEYLQKLDDLKDRVIDNADFFAVNNINQMSDEELYNKLLTEYPYWIKEAKEKKILK